MKTALITGITGQDGSYMADFLLEKGYKVYGLIRNNSSPNYYRIEKIKNEVELVQVDILDSSAVFNAVKKILPDFIYHFAAQSFVALSWRHPLLTYDINLKGTLNLLEAVRNAEKDIRFYNAASSEMFGSTSPPQNEESIFNPQSPYAISKLAAYWETVNHRKSYNMFACSGICFNHESPRRGLEFVTRKITNTAAKIYFGLADKISLGNIEAKRDWSHAKDVIQAIYLMLNDDKPDDYVIASGQAYSVREFAEKVFKKINKSFYDYLEINKEYMRPTEVNFLLGDSAKIRSKLNWQPQYSLDNLVDEMLEEDMRLVEKEIAEGVHR